MIHPQKILLLKIRLKHWSTFFYQDLILWLTKKKGNLERMHSMDT